MTGSEGTLCVVPARRQWFINQSVYFLKERIMTALFSGNVEQWIHTEVTKRGSLEVICSRYGPYFFVLHSIFFPVVVSSAA